MSEIGGYTMDSIVEKFGLYDVMGIWGAGALTVTYFLFTSWNYLVVFLSKFGITNPIQNELYLIIILYTAVSYFIGVILQEIGKVLIDIIPMFDLRKADNFLNDKTTGKGLFKKIYNAFAKEVQETIPKANRSDISFYKAYSYIKHSGNTNTKKIDKYHSVYALARSLSLCFFTHFLFQGVSWLWLSAPSFPSLVIMSTDLLLVVLFMERSYRYFNSWIREAFVQYYVLMYTERERTEDRIING